MKIIFVLDDQSVLVSSPEELQLRQIQPELAALVIPAGQNENNEDLFRPLVTYPVVLSTPPTPRPEPIQAGQALPVPQQPKSKSKAKKAVKKA